MKRHAFALSEWISSLVDLGGLQEPNYDFYGKMKLFDHNDRDSIEWGLKHVFDYDVPRINAAVAAQVLPLHVYGREPCLLFDCLLFLLVMIDSGSGAGKHCLGNATKANGCSVRRVDGMAQAHLEMDTIL